MSPSYLTFPAESSPAACAMPSRARLAATCVACVAAGVCNNVSYVVMGRMMPGYPVFLLVLTTALSAVAYAVWLRMRGAGRRGCSDGVRFDASSLPPLSHLCSPQRFERHTSETAPLLSVAPIGVRKPWGAGSTAVVAHYVGISFLVVVSGTMAQLSDAHVDGPVQAALNQASPLLTVATAELVLGQRHPWRQRLGSLAIFAVCVLPVPFASGGGPRSSSSPWILLFALSQVPVAAVAVWEQHLFACHPAQTDEVRYLAHTSAWTLGGYLLLLPAMSSSSRELVDGAGFLLGSAGASVVVAAFVASLIVHYYALTCLSRQHGAVEQVVATALVAPCSDLVFSSRFVLRSMAQPLNLVQSLSACAVVPVVLAMLWCAPTTPGGGSERAPGGEEAEDILQAV